MSFTLGSARRYMPVSQPCCNKCRPASLTPVHNHLLFFLLSVIATFLLSLRSLRFLPPHTAGAASTEGRGESEVDVLLGVKTDNERGDVDDLLADAEMVVSMV